MAHAIWKGSLTFGLVNIPVNLYSASKPEGLNFHLFRKQDFSPIKYQRVALADNKEVPYEDIVRGYEYQKNDFVTLTNEELKKADVKRTQSIEIMHFVCEDEIDSIYFEKPYFIEPSQGAEKPYALMLEALKKTKKVAVGTFVLRNRERLGIIRPFKDMLILEQLRFADELRPKDEIELPESQIAQGEKELAMAVRLIDEMTEKFNENSYKDTYKEELLDIIKEKAKKGTVAPRSKEVKATDFEDIMEELKKSLEKTKSKR